MIQDQEVDRVVLLYNRVGEYIAQTATRFRRLQLVVLILSVLTTGSLWLLLAESLPQTALWFGAIASTTVTGITLYLQSSDIGRRNKYALSVFMQLGQFIAQVREAQAQGRDLDKIRYWPMMKEFEAMFRKVRDSLDLDI